MPTPAELMQTALGHMQSGRFAPAIELLNTAAKVEPDNAEVLRMLGECRFRSGNPVAGLETLQASARLDPDNAKTWFSIGAVLALTQRSKPAADAFARVVEIEPANAIAWACLGKTLQTAHEIDEAVDAYTRAIELQPNHLEARTDLANCYLHTGRIDEAIAEFRDALRIKPDHISALDCLCTALNYPDGLDPHDVFEVHKSFGEAVMKLPPLNATTTVTPQADLNPDRPLRIGYLSADLYEHSVAYFTSPLLAHRDSANFETHCYHTGKGLDAVSQELSAAADHFTHVRNLNDAQLAARIREDRIDILIELNGHTQNSRLLMLRDKPAPVVVTYIGYPNTTGLPTVDYRIVDTLTDPPEADPFHTEKLIRLPGCFLCYAPREDAPPVAPAPCTANGHVTFGSFNATKKLTPRVVALWCRMLREIPSARLVLKGEAFSSPTSLAHYKAMFDEHDIDPARVDLLGRIPEKGGHLDAYRRIDIGLDPFPYNGTTTTCEAFWMGVPVLSLIGRTHAGRVGLSLLTAIGLPQFAVPDEDAFLRTAAELAANPDHIRDTRAAMRERVAASPLCNGPAFVQQLEAAYRGMWREACARG